MHPTYLVSLLIAGLLAPTAIGAPLSSKPNFRLQGREVVIGAEEGPEIQADAPPAPPAPKPPSQAPPGNANSGPGSSDSENNEAADIVEAETAHNDGSEKLKRVEVVGADESAETRHDTTPSPPSPPSVPKIACSGASSTNTAGECQVRLGEQR